MKVLLVHSAFVEEPIERMFDGKFQLKKVPRWLRVGWGKARRVIHSWKICKQNSRPYEKSETSQNCFDWEIKAYTFQIEVEATEALIDEVLRRRRRVVLSK